MDQVNGYCQPNSGTDDKNTSLKDGKGYYRKDYACEPISISRLPVVRS